MPLAAAQLDDLADLLWTSIGTGDWFPPQLDGLTLDEALALQLKVLRRHQAAGAVLAGWKVGLTSARVRAGYGGIDVRPFGYLDAEHVLRGGPDDPALTVDLRAVAGAAIETELCFTVGERLTGADLGPDAVRAGLAGVAAGYELNQRNPGTLQPDLVLGATARMFNWGIVEGGGVELGGTGAGTVDLAGTRVRMARTDAAGTTTIELDERAGDHVDDHLVSIGLLARALDAHGMALEPGQKIITGAVGRFPATPGDTWRSDFSGVGTVEVRFT